jgi:hypothetical protein
MKNIFVVGLEPFNLALLQGLPDAEQYSFHELLAYDEAVWPSSGHIDLGALLDTAESRIARTERSADGAANKSRQLTGPRNCRTENLGLRGCYGSPKLALCGSSYRLWRG